MDTPAVLNNSIKYRKGKHDVMGKQGQRRVWMDRERKGLNFCFNRFVARSMSRGTKVLLPTIGIGVCSVSYSSFALKHAVSLENAVGRLWIKGERGVKGEGKSRKLEIGSQ